MGTVGWGCEGGERGRGEGGSCKGGEYGGGEELTSGQGEGKGWAACAKPHQSISHHPRPTQTSMRSVRHKHTLSFIHLLRHQRDRKDTVNRLEC